MPLSAALTAEPEASSADRRYRMRRLMSALTPSRPDPAVPSPGPGGSPMRPAVTTGLPPQSVTTLTAPIR
jgi:hypothetical protein